MKVTVLMKDIWIGRDYECLKTEEEIKEAVQFAMEKIDWDVKKRNIFLSKRKPEKAVKK